MQPLHPITTLFPYTTLFRSRLDRFNSNAPSRSRHDPMRAETGLSLGRSPEKTAGPITWIVRPEATNSCTDRKSTRLNSSHLVISYAVFCLKKYNNYTVFNAR